MGSVYLKDLFDLSNALFGNVYLKINFNLFYTLLGSIYLRVDFNLFSTFLSSVNLRLILISHIPSRVVFFLCLRRTVRLPRGKCNACRSTDLIQP